MTELARHHSLPEVVRRRLEADEDALAQAHVYGMRGATAVDLRSTGRLEPRENDDGTVSLAGYATTWNTSYDVAGGPPYGWTESIARGAADTSLRNRDVVHFLYDHEGLPMATNKGQTMRLTADDIGLRMEVDSLDVKRNLFAAALVSAIERGDVDEMSFAFRATRQDWNEDYSQRLVTEVSLFDVSAVGRPANPATIIGMRSQSTTVCDLSNGLPLSLALAQVDSLRYHSI